MIKAPISLQDLRRSLHVKAKAEPARRFWGLYVHVCKRDTLYEAYRMAKENDGAPGIDGVTFEAIEESGVEGFLEQIRDELVSNTYRPMRARKKEIPKDGGKKVRVLSIPSIRDRVVQGALKLILEPIFEADFQSGSYGYRPKRTAHQAVARVAQAIVESKTRIIDIDLRAYFDNVQHYLLLEKVARRVQDDEVMHLLKMMLKATGGKGVPQGGVISPLLSNVYLTEVDRMLERVKGSTRSGKLNIPRQSEQGFHGKKNTNSTAKLMPIPRQKEQGFHAIANRISGWRRRGSTVARSTVLSGVPNGKCQVDHAQNQGSAAAAFRVRPQPEGDRRRGRRLDNNGVALPAPHAAGRAELAAAAGTADG